MAAKGVPDLSRCLKSTTHLNIGLSPGRPDQPAAADVILEWLGRRAGMDPKSPRVQAHLAELSLRRQGGHSIPEVAARMGVPLSLACSSRLLEVFAFSRLEMDDLVVSVDILNAGNELGIEGAMTGEIVEVFVLACPPDVLASRLGSLLVEMLTELPIQVAAPLESFCGR